PARSVELLDAPDGIFLERQRPAVVEVELVEVAAARGEIFHRLDLAVLVFVVARKALLFASLRGGLRCLERFAEEGGSSGGWSGRQARCIFGPRLPDEEGTGQKKEAGGSAREKTQHWNLPERGDSARRHPSERRRSCQPRGGR